MPPMLLRLAEAAAGRVGLYRWVCADPHSEQITMAGDPGQVTPVYLTRRLLKHVMETVEDPAQVCLAFPDDSACKRFDRPRARIENDMDITLPHILALKRRIDANTSKIVGIVGNREDVEGRTVVMLDDEIATGGSMIKFAKILKEDYGAGQVFGTATHGVFCGPAAQRFSAEDCPIDKIIVTSTIPLPQGGELEAMRDLGRLCVVSWEEDMAWVIYNNHWDESIRGLR